MNGRLNVINEYYETACKRVNEYLASRFSLSICELDDEDYPASERVLSPRATWRVSLGVNADPRAIIVAVPYSFPDSLPRFYVGEPEREDGVQRLHVDRNGLICTRDGSVVFLREEHVGEGVEELLQIAIRTATARSSSAQQQEFSDEFLAYWRDRVECPYQVLSIAEPGTAAKRMVLLKELDPPLLGRFPFFLADSEGSAGRWLSKIGWDGAYQVCDALHLHLTSAPDAVPTCNGDILSLLNEEGQPSLKAAETYYNTNNGRVVITSYVSQGSFVLFGWVHPIWTPSDVVGFRKRKIPVQIRLSRTKGSVIQGLAIQRADDARMAVRTAGNHDLVFPGAEVAVIGCGSVGSALAVSLVKLGIKRLTLVDEEDLRVENIPRHICGFPSVGTRKAQAVTDHIHARHPAVDCRPVDGDVLELLGKGELDLSNADLVVSCTGSYAVDRRLNWLLRLGGMDCPVVFVWVEALLVSGHVMVVHPTEGGCFQCVHPDDQFDFAVCGNPTAFSMREAGCQSTYLPYSGFSVGVFAAFAARRIAEVIRGEITRSTLYTLLGDMREFEARGGLIAPSWSASSSETQRTTEIEQRRDCLVCQT